MLKELAEVQVTLTVVVKDPDPLFQKLSKLAADSNLTCRNADADSGLFFGTESGGSYDWDFAGGITDVQSFLTAVSRME